MWGAVAHWLKYRTVSQENHGVRVQLLLFQNFGNCDHHTFGKDTKAVGPFYLVSMPEEVIDPTRVNMQPAMDSISQPYE